MYKDISGLFVTKIKDINQEQNEYASNNSKSSKSKESTKIVFNNKDNEEIDDLDELLYGDSDVNAIVGASIKNTLTNKQSDEDKNSELDERQRISIKNIEEQQPTYWLFLTRDDGSLEVYSMPDVTLVYHINDFATAPQTLVDTLPLQSTPTAATNNNFDNNSSLLEIYEIYIGGFGIKQSKPLLFVRFKEEICVYEAFQYTSSEIDNHLKIRFTKLEKIH